MNKQELINFLKDNLDILLKVGGEIFGTFKNALLEVSISLCNEEICTDFIDIDDILDKKFTYKNNKNEIRPKIIGIG